MLSDDKGGEEEEKEDGFEEDVGGGLEKLGRHHSSQVRGNSTARVCVSNISDT